jgi:hypothetical protein
MSLPWFRLYHEFAGDTIVQTMSEAMQRRLIMVFCFKASGALEKLDEKELAKALSITQDELAETKAAFIRKGFIGPDWQPTNWKKRQEFDHGAAARMRKHREQERNGSATNGATVTAHSRASVSVSVFESPEGDARGNQILPIEPGPEFTALGHLAIEMSSVLGLGSWVSNMGRLGYTPAMVRYALEEGAAAGKWDQRWLQGILKRVAVDGVPEPEYAATESSPLPASVMSSELQRRIDEWEKQNASVR